MKTIAARFQQIHGKARPVLGTCLYGLVASLAAVGFQLAINWIYQRCYKNTSTGSFGHFAWISLAAIIASANCCPLMTGITTSEINGPGVLVESAPAITAVHAGANRTTTDGCDSNKMIFAANVFHGRQF